MPGATVRYCRVRQRLHERVVFWAGWLLAGVSAVWLLGHDPALGRLCAGLGLGYALVSMVRPQLMPKMKTPGLPEVPERVALLSHRILGAASIPLWVMAWRNRPVHLPPGIVMPVAVGIAAGVVAQMLRREGDGGGTSAA